MALFYGSALLVVLRFRVTNLAFWIVAFNALLMVKAEIGWDKYALAAIVCLWYLQAEGDEERAVQ